MPTLPIVGYVTKSAPGRKEKILPTFALRLRLVTLQETCSHTRLTFRQSLWFRINTPFNAYYYWAYKSDDNTLLMGSLSQISSLILTTNTMLLNFCHSSRILYLIGVLFVFRWDTLKPCSHDVSVVKFR